jgi:hypothetical protein
MSGYGLSKANHAKYLTLLHIPERLSQTISSSNTKLRTKLRQVKLARHSTPQFLAEYSFTYGALVFIPTIIQKI